LKTSPALLLVVVGLFFSINTILNTKIIEHNEPAEQLCISAIELYNDFQIDPIAAEANFKDKDLIITGVFADWGYNPISGYYIILVSDEYGNQSISCYWRLELDTLRIADLIGQEITLEGSYGDWSDGNLKLYNCTSTVIPVINGLSHEWSTE